MNQCLAKIIKYKSLKRHENLPENENTHFSCYGNFNRIVVSRSLNKYRKCMLLILASGAFELSVDDMDRLCMNRTNSYQAFPLTRTIFRTC